MRRPFSGLRSTCSPGCNDTDNLLAGNPRNCWVTGRDIFGLRDVWRDRIKIDGQRWLTHIWPAAVMSGMEGLVRTHTSVWSGWNNLNARASGWMERRCKWPKRLKIQFWSIIEKWFDLLQISWSCSYLIKQDDFPAGHARISTSNIWITWGAQPSLLFWIVWKQSPLDCFTLVVRAPIFPRLVDVQPAHLNPYPVPLSAKSRDLIERPKRNRQPIHVWLCIGPDSDAHDWCDITVDFPSNS